MSDVSLASIREDAPGELALVGVIDYGSGPALREAGRELIAASSVNRLVIDCADVEKSSSVGVSLLLSFMRDVRQAGKSLVVRNLPCDMRQIAQVSEVLEVLPLEA
ncbi:STAS domain-containing protein [Pseudomonas sp. PS02288]|uniref:STAS domain-containing protein n=1 Tax=Pseudomonas sp. PS02288 TaxID=2991443 RepID=UPI00249BB109|nr:STAS domain-containing protein [Pseudomonas sp. PS02288]